MASAEELTLDIEELQEFLRKAQRQKIKSILSSQIKKLQDEITLLHYPTMKANDDNAQTFNINATKTASHSDARCYEVKLSNYAWDQSDKFVKVYVTLNKVHTIPKDNIKCEFTTKSMELTVCGLDNKNYSLVLGNLCEPIIADGSHFKVKTDSLVIFLKKESSKNWNAITVHDKKAKEPKVPKMDEDADPSKGLMDLMKQMYEDGDDEMKRTIAKAWTESRNKSPELGGL